MATTDTLEVGTSVEIWADFRASKTLIDPTTVTLRVKAPGGTPATPIVIHDGTGQFHASVPVNTAGQWKYRWESTVPLSAEEGSFVVRKSQVI